MNANEDSVQLQYGNQKRNVSIQSATTSTIGRLFNLNPDTIMLDPIGDELVIFGSNYNQQDLLPVVKNAKYKVTGDISAKQQKINQQINAQKIRLLEKFEPTKISNEVSNRTQSLFQNRQFYTQTPMAIGIMRSALLISTKFRDVSLMIQGQSFEEFRKTYPSIEHPHSLQSCILDVNHQLHDAFAFTSLQMTDLTLQLNSIPENFVYFLSYFSKGNETKASKFLKVITEASNACKDNSSVAMQRFETIMKLLYEMGRAFIVKGEDLAKCKNNAQSEQDKYDKFKKDAEREYQKFMQRKEKKEKKKTVIKEDKSKIDINNVERQIRFACADSEKFILSGREASMRDEYEQNREELRECKARLAIAQKQETAAVKELKTRQDEMNQLRSQESYIRQRHVQSIEELSQARDEKSEAAQAKNAAAELNRERQRELEQERNRAAKLRSTLPKDSDINRQATESKRFLLLFSKQKVNQNVASELRTQRDRKLHEQDLNVKLKAIDLEESSQKFEDAGREFALVNERVESKQEAAEIIASKVVETANQVSAARTEYENAEIDMMHYSVQAKQIQDEKDRQSKEIEQIQAKIRDTKRQIDEKHTEMTDLRERIDNDKQRSNTLGEKLSKLQIKLKGVEMDIDAEHKKIAEFTLKLKSFDIETASLDSFMEFVVFAMNTMNEIEDCWSKLRLFFARIDNFVSKINELDFEQFRDVLDDNDRGPESIENLLRAALNYCGVCMWLEVATGMYVDVNERFVAPLCNGSERSNAYATTAIESAKEQKSQISTELQLIENNVSTHIEKLVAEKQQYVAERLNSYYNDFKEALMPPQPE